MRKNREGRERKNVCERERVCMCVSERVRVYVRVCVRACACVCVRVCVRACVSKKESLASSAICVIVIRPRSHPLPLLLRSRVHSRNLLQETGGWCRVGTLLVSGITRGESTALEKLVVESIVISQWNKQKGINSIGEFSRRTSTYPYLLLPLPYHNHPLPPLPYHHHHCPLAAYPHKR